MKNVLFAIFLMVLLSGCTQYHRPMPSPEWEIVPDEQKSIQHVIVEDLRFAGTFKVQFQLDGPLFQSDIYSDGLCIGDKYLLTATFRSKPGYAWTKTCITDYGGPGWELVKTE